MNNVDESEDENPEFRYLSSDCGIQPNKRNNYGIPKDVIDMFGTSQSENIADASTITIDDVINNKLVNVIEIFSIVSLTTHLTRKISLLGILKSTPR